MRNFIVITILFTLLTSCANTANEKVKSEKNAPAHATAANTVVATAKPTENADKATKSAPTIAPKSSELIVPKQDVVSLVPKGWHILDKFDEECVVAKSDLNKDGISDVAIVIEQDNQLEDGAPPRKLMIAFGNSNNGYDIFIQAEKAVLKATEGGGFGDPFSGIFIEDGIFVLDFFGGSSERWQYTYKFRFQNSQFYLIGATEKVHHYVQALDEVAVDEEDYNLLSGDYIFDKTDEKGKQTVTKGNRGKKPLVNLKDFVASIYDKQY